MEHIAPVRAEERIESIDVLRGFSLLGILLMNICAFGLPMGAYMNPSIHGGATGANLTFWLVNQTLFEGKMRAIFSMLFGAGGYVLTSRAERRGAGVETADIYYRRTMWLIVIGLIHAHLIWDGDILYAYGVAGLLMFPFRRMSARGLIIAGAVVLTLHSLQGLGARYGIGEMIQKSAEADKLMAEGKKPSHEQKEAQTQWRTMRDMFAPEKESVEREIKAHRGGWVDNLKQRSGIAAQFEFQIFFQFVFLDVFGMLLMGMGLAKTGVFDASLSYRAYAIMIAAGLGLGTPLNYWAGRQWIASGFAVPDWFGYILSTADPGRFLVAAAYIGIIMIVCKAGALGWFRFLLGSVGRLALTNYLLTSVLCTLFFNGYGLGYYAKLERAQLLWVVFAMWTVNLIISPIWLRYFRYGPAEWAWRSLTYWEKQPMRRVIAIPQPLLQSEAAAD